MKPLRLSEYEGTTSLLLDAGNTKVDDAIVDGGHEPNGPFWEGVAALLVATQAPELEDRFEYDSEAGMFCAHSTDRLALEKLGALMAKVANNIAELQAILVLAEEKGFEFDD